MRFFVAGVVAALVLSAIAFQSRDRFQAPPGAGDRATRAELEYSVVSKYDFDTTIEKIKEAAIAEKYGVQGTHEISKILTEKGFPRERLTIVEICNPKAASESLQQDIRTSLMMPCPVSVFLNDGEVHVMTFNTAQMAAMYEGDQMPAIGARVNEALMKILSSVDENAETR